MKAIITSLPESEPCTIDDIKQQARIDTDEDDLLIQSYIIAAREYCESISGNKFNFQRWEVYFDEFPQIIEIPIRPIVNVSQVSYYRNGFINIINANEYRVSNNSFRAKIYPVDSWPDTDEREDAVKIQVDAGYAFLPERIKQAVRMLAATWYEYREDLTTESVRFVPHGVSQLLSVDTNKQFL